MKLTPDLKAKIDSWFDNISSEELLEIAKTYGILEENSKSVDEQIFTLKQVQIYIKAFHLDCLDGAYSKEHLNWCNDWIEKNIINPI